MAGHGLHRNGERRRKRTHARAGRDANDYRPDQRALTRLFREQLLDLRREILPRVLRRQLALLVYEPHRRDRVDAVLRAELILPGLAIEELRPRHLLRLRHRFELRAIRVEGDADDLE